MHAVPACRWSSDSTGNRSRCSSRSGRLQLSGCYDERRLHPACPPPTASRNKRLARGRRPRRSGSPQHVTSEPIGCELRLGYGRLRRPLFRDGGGRRGRSGRHRRLAGADRSSCATTRSTDFLARRPDIQFTQSTDREAATNQHRHGCGRGRRTEAVCDAGSAASRLLAALVKVGVTLTWQRRRASPPRVSGGGIGLSRGR